MSIRSAVVQVAVLALLSACSHLPGSSEFVCNDAAKDRPVIDDVDTRGEALAALLNALASLGANPDFREESAAALSRCDREFLIWYVQMSADDPERLTDHDRKRFERLTSDS